MMYSSYRAVHAQEEDETYLMEDNHQSATIPVHHRQQTNKQKHRYLMGGTDHFSVSVTKKTLGLLSSADIQIPISQSSKLLYTNKGVL